MPEGPEVKTVARTLAEKLEGCVLGSLWHSHHRLRRAVDYEALRVFEKKRIDNVSSYGKILFISVDNKTAFMAQLGMTGQLTVNHINEPLKAHTHLRWSLLQSDRELRYVDPRRFGLVEACDDLGKEAILKRLGPDPFSIKDADHEALIKTMSRSTRSIKEILLDQSVVVGVGNIYASEALFMAKIHPEKRGVDIAETQYQRLIVAIIDILNLAYKNSGTTFSNYVDGSGKKGDNLKFLKVFQRALQPCLLCKSLILRIKQGGRSTFYCPKCQGGAP